MINVSDNYKRIVERIENAALSVGRNPGEVELIAVTKFVEPERIEQAISAGAKSVGENRVQEYLKKADFFKSHSLNRDIIGNLQLNKAKYIVGDVRYIQSVDRLSLAQEINKLALKKQTVQNVLIEVNIGDEEQKGGVAVCELYDLLYEISQMQGIHVDGLMCIPPAVTEDEARKYFCKMRELFFNVQSKNIEGISMNQLSMGMSGDFEAAVKEGATMVRVGSAIFGARY